MSHPKIVMLLSLVVCFSILVLVACNWGDGYQGALVTPGPGQISHADLTATFGADQFHIQLTAIAKEAQMSSTGGAAWP